MKYANINECRAAGLDPKVIEKLAARLKRSGDKAGRLGLLIFGGSGAGELRYTDDRNKGDLKVASFGGNVWDGGDGADKDWGDGLLRGE